MGSANDPMAVVDVLLAAVERKARACTTDVERHEMLLDLGLYGETAREMSPDSLEDALGSAVGNLCDNVWDMHGIDEYPIRDIERHVQSILDGDR